MNFSEIWRQHRFSCLSNLLFTTSASWYGKQFSTRRSRLALEHLEVGRSGWDKIKLFVMLIFKDSLVVLVEGGDTIFLSSNNNHLRPCPELFYASSVFFFWLSIPATFSNCFEATLYFSWCVVSRHHVTWSSTSLDDRYLIDKERKQKYWEKRVVVGVIRCWGVQSSGAGEWVGVDWSIPTVAVCSGCQHG